MTLIFIPLKSNPESQITTIKDVLFFWINNPFKNNKPYPYYLLYKGHEIILVTWIAVFVSVGGRSWARYSVTIYYITAESTGKSVYFRIQSTESCNKRTLIRWNITVGNPYRHFRRTITTGIGARSGKLNILTMRLQILKF